MRLNENEYIVSILHRELKTVEKQMGCSYDKEKTVENCIHCHWLNRCEACKKLVSTEQQRRDTLNEQEKILKRWLTKPIFNRYYSTKPW